MVENFLFLADNQHVGLVHNNQFYPVAYLNSDMRVVFTDSHFSAEEYAPIFMTRPTISIANSTLATAVFCLGDKILSFIFDGGGLCNFTMHHYVHFNIRFVVSYSVLRIPVARNHHFADRRVEFGANDLDPDQTLMVFKILNQLARLR